jgi:hypothetical protein
MGKSELSWGAIGEWAREIGIDLAPWQKRILRRLSRDYLNESERATKPDCPPPWQPEEMTPHSRELVGAKIMSVLKRLARRRDEEG